MKESEIITRNKLIAEFMGGCYTDVFHAAPKDIPVFAIYARTVNELKYDSSWDWLMPVVEKIEDTTCHEYYFYQITIWKNCCKISDGNNGYEINSTFHPESKIKAVWSAVVEFIKWYNKQSK